MFLFMIGCAFFGSVLASAVTCISWRHNHSISQRGRSFCDVCRAPLAWWQLIPIAGFAFCRGKCRTCHSRVPAWYFIVEIGTALAFALGVWHFDVGPELLWFFALTILLLFITCQDLLSHTISDAWQIGFLFLSLVHLFMGWGEVLPVRLLGSALLVVPLILVRYFSPEGLGTGDVLFVANMGFLLGPGKGVTGFALGIAAALFYAIWLLLQGAGRRTALPLLPFLSLGTLAGVLLIR